jgi:hypothetical protein
MTRLMVYVVGEELNTKGRITDESDEFYDWPCWPEVMSFTIDHANPYNNVRVFEWSIPRFYDGGKYTHTRFDNGFGYKAS